MKLVWIAFELESCPSAFSINRNPTTLDSSAVVEMMYTISIQSLVLPQQYGGIKNLIDPIETYRETLLKQRKIILKKRRAIAENESGMALYDVRPRS
jgi:hypothetical protein